MSINSVPKVSPNYTKYNARSKTLVNVKCCVCLESYHPATVFFCRACDSGIVCVECMKSVPKGGYRYDTDRNKKYRANIAYRGPTNAKVILEYERDGQWTDGNQTTASSYTDASNSSSSTEVNNENIREICFITYERKQVYGYGNKYTKEMPKCPCCRGTFTFLQKGYKINGQKLHVHHANAHTKLIKTMVDAPSVDETGRSSSVNRQLAYLKRHCESNISTTTGQWNDSTGWNYNNYTIRVTNLPNFLLPEVTPSGGSSGHNNATAIMLANSITVEGVEEDTSGAGALFNEGENLRALVEDYDRRFKALTLTPMSSHPLLKLFSTQEGRDSVRTDTPVKDYVVEYVMTTSGLYIDGLPSATASKKKAKVKALPTSVEDVMKSFGSMTIEERALLAAELNAM